jgi:hypothetical protein
MGKTTMDHLVLATGPCVGRAMRIEGRGEPGQLSGVTSTWDAQWKGVRWAAAGFIGPCAGEEAGLGLGCTKIEKREGKKRLVRPGSASSWVSAHYQIGIRNSFFQIIL